jgi:hypothetical protein
MQSNTLRFVPELSCTYVSRVAAPRNTLFRGIHQGKRAVP